MYTFVLYSQQLVFWGLNKYQNKVFASRNTPLCFFMIFTLHFQLHLMKSLKIGSIVLFAKLYNQYLGFK